MNSVTKLVKERCSSVLPIALSGIVYLVSHIVTFGYQFHLCPSGSGAQYYSCGDLDVYYGAPLFELSIVLVPIGFLGLVVPKSMRKYWLIAFTIWLAVTVLWMLSISDPQGHWENHRSATADISGAVFFLTTLIWLSVHYFVTKDKKRKGSSVSE